MHDLFSFFFFHSKCTVVQPLYEGVFPTILFGSILISWTFLQILLCLAWLVFKQKSRNQLSKTPFFFMYKESQGLQTSKVYQAPMDFGSLNSSQNQYKLIIIGTYLSKTDMSSRFSHQTVGFIFDLSTSYYAPGVLDADLHVPKSVFLVTRVPVDKNRKLVKEAQIIIIKD